MRRNRAFLLLIVLAVLVGGWLLFAQQATTPPPAPSDPAAVAINPPGSSDSAPLPILDQWPNAGSGERVPDAPDRVRAAIPEVGDARVAAVTIAVVIAEPGHADVPAPYVEVALFVGDDGGKQLTMCEVAGPDGLARFEVEGGDGLSARATTALGGGVEVPLIAQQMTKARLAIVPRAIVQGHVVDAAGRGIVGADLVLTPWDDRTANPPRLWHLGHSAGDGSFRFSLTMGGCIGALHPDYAASPTYLVRSGPTAAAPVTTSVLLTMLSQEMHLPGRVVDADGKPVANAELEFRAGARAPRGAQSASVPLRVRSKPDGSFLVTNLAPGMIEFAARAEGHGRIRGSLQLANDTPTPFEVRLPASCSVLGRVTDAAGKALAEVLVTAGEPGAFDSVGTHTDANGAYRLADLAPGANRMAARGTSAGKRCVAQAVVQLAPEQPASWNVVLDPAAARNQLTGVVVDIDDKPLAGWRVELRGSGGAREQTDTTADGSFALSLRGAPPWDLRVFAPGRQRLQFADEVLRDVDPTAGPARIVVDRRLRRVVIRGRVMTDAQEGVAADIECWHQERAEWVSFRAESDGSFVIPGVPAGTLDLAFKHPGECPATRANVLIQDADIDLGIVTLGAAGSMFGKVTGADGRVPEVCELFLVRGDKVVNAEYSGGTYRFEAVPPGTHTLHVQGPTLAAYTVEVTITAGVERKCDIKMQAGVPRRFRVVIPPMAGDLVSMTVHEPGQAMNWLGSAPARRSGPNADAEVTFVASMMPGSYEVVAWARTYSAQATVTFAEGDDTEIRLQLVSK